MFTKTDELVKPFGTP